MVRFFFLIYDIKIFKYSKYYQYYHIINSSHTGELITDVPTHIWKGRFVKISQRRKWVETGRGWIE